MDGVEGATWVSVMFALYFCIGVDVMACGGCTAQSVSIPREKYAAQLGVLAVSYSLQGGRKYCSASVLLIVCRAILVTIYSGVCHIVATMLDRCNSLVLHNL